MTNPLPQAAPPPPPPPPDPNDAIAKETARLKAETELAKARAELIKAYGLPSFEGKTKLNENAGAIEALILATDALDQAARRIAGAAAEIADRPHSGGPRSLLVLAGDEAPDFGLATSMRAEVAAFDALFDGILPDDGPRSRMVAPSASLASPAVIGAIAGLLGHDTEVTAVDHAALGHRVLATAVAGRLAGRAILNSTIVTGNALSAPLILDVMALARRRDAVAGLVPGRPEAEGAALTAAIARFDAFLGRVLAADASGRVPLVQAARLEQLSALRPLLLRVHVEKAGGSLVQRSNILTFFGADPVRVSGGLVASYAISDPESGFVLAAEVLNGRTAIARLGDIQAGGSLARPLPPAPATGLFSRPVGASAPLRQLMGVTKTHVLKVKANDAALTWAIFIDTKPVLSAGGDGDAELSLAAGEHSLMYDVRGAGAKIEIELTGDPAPTFVLPRDGKWPFAVAVPSDRTALAERLYFGVGG